MADHIPTRLRAMRLAAGLSQRDLAASLGVTRPAISQIESGVNRTDYTKLAAWAEACGFELTFQSDPGALSAEDEVLVARFARALERATARERRVWELELDLILSDE